ncbi:MAG: cytochrome c biogenesis CcdA family protein [Candidatus Actinomarina sp.]|tara:strand:+ start:5635 stop:6342 length:708 start_codon:yes stop_codon:yes gene_type:complete
MELNIFISFFFGMLSFFSPCVLPLVPGFLSVFSLSSNDTKTRMIGSLQFVLGFSFVFVSLGALASTLGSFFTRNASVLSQISGMVIILFGIILLVPTLNNRYFYSSNIIQVDKYTKSKNFIMGFTFGFGFTPCIGPVLGALLTLSSSAETVNLGIVYLLFFSIGMGIPFLTLAFLSNKISMRNSLFQNFQKVSTKISGTTLIIIGVLIFSDRMYLLASIFQDILYFLNLDWLSTI